MLKEVLTRRFKHPEWPMPNLIMVDGGKAQLLVALKAVSEQIPIIALTKDAKHIAYKIVLKTGKEILLSKIPAVTKNLILHINTEAHRFAIEYYRIIHRRN